MPTGPQLGIHYPTLAWLAGLPTDPEELLARLRGEGAHPVDWNADHQLWGRMAQIYAYCEIALSPRQRAALLRAFTGMSGMSVRDVEVDGKLLVAIRQTDDTDNGGNEILFDPATGRAVGRGSTYSGDDVTITQAPSGPVLAPGVLYQATWTQSIVD